METLGGCGNDVPGGMDVGVAAYAVSGRLEVMVCGFGRCWVDRLEYRRIIMC